MRTRTEWAVVHRKQSGALVTFSTHATREGAMSDIAGLTRVGIHGFEIVEVPVRSTSAGATVLRLIKRERARTT